MNTRRFFTTIPFHYGFWLLFHGILLATHLRIAQLLLDPGSLLFAYALLFGTAQWFFFSFCALLVWETVLRRFLSTPRWENLFYALLGFSVALNMISVTFTRFTGTGLGLFFRYVWNLSFTDLRDMFIATQISTANLALMAAVVALLPPGLWFFAKGTLTLSRRHPLRVPTAAIALVTVLSFGLIFVAQWGAGKTGEGYHWRLFTGTLPVALFLQDRPGESTTLAAHVVPYERLDVKASQLAVAADHLPRRLNLFVFIFETIREDFVTAENTPHLLQFREQNLSFRNAFCPANSTHYSWFATLYSAYPIYWNAQRKETDQRGSPFLQILKKAGFRIHLYAKSHHLRYLSFGTLSFGKNHALIDQASIQPDMPQDRADRLSIEQLNALIRSGLPPGRNLYLIFLDSTHHNYFIPPEGPAPFTPYVEDFTYLKWDYPPAEVRQIRNRYKNALFYVDSLFGQVIGTLQKTGNYTDAWIGLTADHGEEFMEHGALIHGSNFFDPQMRVPLYYKAPGHGGNRLDRTLTGIDFFPTLLDLLGLYEQAKDVLQGRSALPPRPVPMALLTNNHADADPYQFALFNGRYKALFHLDPNRPLDSRQVTFSQVFDRDDRPMTFAGKAGGDLSLFLHQEFSRSLGSVPFLKFDTPP